MALTEKSNVQMTLPFWANLGTQNTETEKSGQSFADLLVRQTDASAKTDVSANDVRNKSDMTDKPRNNDTDKADRAEKKADKADANKSEKNDRSNKTDETQNKPKKETKKLDTETTNKSANSAAPMVSEEETTEISAKNALLAGAFVVAPEVLIPEDTFSLQTLSTEEIAALPVIVVVNPENGQTMEVSGKEFLEMVKNFEAMPEVTLPENGSAPVVELLPENDVAEVAPVFEKFAQLVNEFRTLPKNDTKTDKPIETAPQAVVEDETMLVKQADKIVEVIQPDKETKIKIEVKVNDKQADVVVNKPATATLKASEEVESVKSFETEPQTPTKTVVQKHHSEDLSVADVMIQDNEMIDTPIQVQANPAAQAAAIEAVSIAPSKGAETLTSSAASHFSATELNTPRTDTAATDKTSFREVYKGMSQDVIEQVKVNITKSAVKGVDKIDIQLKPEGLGKVEVNLHINKEGKLQAHITSTRADSLETLQRDAASLEKALNDAGFNTDSGSLSFSLREDQNNQQNQKDLRAFMGEALKVQEDAMTDLFPEAWDGKSALNIRV